MHCLIITTNIIDSSSTHPVRNTTRGSMLLLTCLPSIRKLHSQAAGVTLQVMLMFSTGRSKMNFIASAALTHWFTLSIEMSAAKCQHKPRVRDDGQSVQQGIAVGKGAAGTEVTLGTIMANKTNSTAVHLPSPLSCNFATAFFRSVSPL